MFMKDLVGFQKLRAQVFDKILDYTDSLRDVHYTLSFSYILYRDLFHFILNLKF